MDSEPACPPPSINIVAPFGNATKIESPWPTSSTSTSSLPRSRFGANGWDTTSNVSEASARAEAHSAGRIGGDNFRRTLGFNRRAATALAHIARQMNAAKKAIASHIGGPGIRYDNRGQWPNHSTLESKSPVQKPSAFASSNAKFAQTKDASSATKPRGTMIAVSNTAGILLKGPARLTRWK